MARLIAVMARASGRPFGWRFIASASPTGYCIDPEGKLGRFGRQSGLAESGLLWRILINTDDIGVAHGRRAPIFGLFTCLYDEREPVGSLGRGTHYSIFRSVEWLDVTRRPLAFPQIHDFAVIWDEDHDERVIEAVEQIYMAGLLSPVQFIGERKGGLTAVVAAKFYFTGSEADTEAYRQAVEAISQGLADSWPTELGSFDRNPGSPHQTFSVGLIGDSEHRVGLYLSNIGSLWRLGSKPYALSVPFVPAWTDEAAQPTVPFPPVALAPTR